MSDEPKAVQVTPVQVLQAQLAMRAAATAGATAKQLGFPQPTPEQAQRITELLTRGCAGAAALVLAAAFAPGDPVVATDEQLDEIADRLAFDAVREVLGAAPHEGLN